MAWCEFDKYGDDIDERSRIHHEQSAFERALIRKLYNEQICVMRCEWINGTPIKMFIKDIEAKDNMIRLHFCLEMPDGNEEIISIQKYVKKPSRFLQRLEEMMISIMQMILYRSGSDLDVQLIDELELCITPKNKADKQIKF